MTEPQNAPQDLDAERYVLGACMTGPNAVERAGDIITPHDFYLTSYGTIFNACQTLHTQGDPVEWQAVSAELERTGDLERAGGKTKIVELANLAPASANVAHFAAIVKEKATLRALLRASQEIQASVWERQGDAVVLVDQAEQTIYDLAKSQRADTNFNPEVPDTVKNLARLREHPHELIGTPSGYTALDRVTQGFIPGNLIIVAARPSMGKSALAFNIGLRLVGRGVPVGIWTMEMSKAEIVQRMLSIGASVPGEHVRDPRKATEDEWTRLLDAGTKLEQAPLYVSEQGTFTPMEIRSQIRRVMAQAPLGLVVVDYLSLMSAEAENRTQEVSKISQMLKATARDLRVPIMALAQLNRNLESRPDKRPILSDLRESGSIEQDADLCIFLYRDDYYHPESQDKGWCEIHIAKHRNGPTDRVKLVWKKEYAQFSNPALSAVSEWREAA